MKKVVLLFILFFSLMSVSAQNHIFYRQLKIFKGIAYYQNIPYTGEVIVKYDSAYYKYQYKDGLKNCKIKIGNKYSSYKMGLIDDYKFYYKNEVLFQYSPKLSDKIVSIDVGIWFENQRNDTLFLDTTLIDDFTEFKVGLILTSRYGTLSFVEIPQLEFISCAISVCCMPGAIEEYKITTTKVRNKIFYSWVGYIFYVDYMNLNVGNGVNMIFYGQKYYIKGIP